MSDPTDRAWQSTIRTRVLVAAAFFALWVVAIEARLVWLQVYRYDDFVARAAQQQKHLVDVPARRGDIVDRNGQTLALSVDAASICAVPKEVQDPDVALALICQAIGGCQPDEQGLYAKRLSQKRAFVYLRRRIPPDEAARVAALKLPGISLMTEQRRYYPNRELAAHVVGYVGVDGNGLGGIEAAYDSKISGQKGTVLVEVDGSHHVFTTRVKRPPTSGATVELTIDRVLQHIVERELHDAVVRHHAAGGTAIVMDPRTGEVLALANEPTYNPNAYNDSKVEDLRNRGVQELYEPGSTFKVVTASAAIEEQAFRTDELIDVSAGSIHIGSREIKDVHASGVLSFTDVIVKSSNVGAIKIGLRLGPERLGRYIRRFGFGTRICPDVEGETPGMVSNPGHWNDSTLASVSMGYEIGVTPLQMAAAVSSVANGGLLVQPRMVRALRWGVSRVEVTPLESRRAIATETSAELLAIMEQVVQRGTGTAAAVPGYTVAGKTGTAAKVVGGRYSKTDYHASFVGFVPSRQPAFTVVVVIDSPHQGGIYGGVVAAPVFKRIAEAALRHLGVPQTVNPVPPIVVTASAAEPVPTMMPTSSRVPGSRLDVVTGSPAVPDVRGLGAREAILRLARLGLVSRLTGDGVVIDQDPAPGTPLEPGTVCRLWLDRVIVPPPLSSPQ
ncbi:MAG: penicillin-binding protein [Acidobacteria bacterium]|nr:penicillin-binding protein [Acidobacteriota bacterium]